MRQHPLTKTRCLEKIREIHGRWLARHEWVERHHDADPMEASDVYLLLMDNCDQCEQLVDAIIDLL